MRTRAQLGRNQAPAAVVLPVPVLLLVDVVPTVLPVLLPVLPVLVPDDEAPVVLVVLAEAVLVAGEPVAPTTGGDICCTMTCT